ncbi:MAG: FG-GAP-like repeat-containing protein [Leptolyngbya sp. Prado105]|nr:FG-GAP-like repeat-containing protein [Leptolyngbya sp. Prado105]
MNSTRSIFAKASSLSTAVTTDLLARDVSTGATQVWSVSNSSLVTRRDLPSELDVNWQVAGIADFNRDAQQDLLWRNARTGAVRLWQMNNGTAQTIALDSVNDFNWSIAGLADFNNDGSADILWHNTQSGEASLWFMNNTAIAAKTTIASTGPSGWRIQGITDLNLDGFADLIWSDLNTGQTAVWTLNRGVFGAGIYLTSAPSLDWKIAEIGDFNGDRTSDLFWRNEKTGETQFWLYNGLQRTQTVASRSLNSAWQPVSSSDLNRDGTNDLLWRNSSTGELLAWFVRNGNPADSTSVFTESNLNWQPIAPLEQSASLLATPTNSTAPVGTITSGDSIASAENQASIFSRSDRVDAGNTSDFYRFSVDQSGIFTASLTGLTGDADVRLVQDTNGSGAIETGEVLAWQWERGTANESIRKFINPGTYFVQVLDYRNQTADYTVATSFTIAASDPQQFQMQLNFADSLTGLSASARDAINQAARFWEGVILNQTGITQTNVLPINLTGEALVSQDGSADAGTLALSGPTLTLDAANNLVITRGSTTLNTRKIAEFNANPIYLRDIMIHEFAHVLGFGTIWEPIAFTYSDGTRVRAGQTWIDRSTATYRANSYAGQAYGDLLGGEATAIPIEPRVFFHWDERRFDAELMTPFAESPGVLMPMSSLTLGALRDLGWSVNFGAVQPYTLPAVAASSASTTANPAGAALLSYKCGCGRCLAAVRTEILSPSLSDQMRAA